jgi:hypothetical protein
MMMVVLELNGSSAMNLNMFEIESEKFKSLIDDLYNLSMSLTVRNDPELFLMVKNMLESLANKIKEEAENRMKAIGEIAVMM